MKESDFHRLNYMQMAHVTLDMICARCCSPIGGCDCLITCSCGWGHFKDNKCRNPDCNIDTNNKE